MNRSMEKRLRVMKGLPMLRESLEPDLSLPGHVENPVDRPGHDVGGDQLDKRNSGECALLGGAVEVHETPLGIDDLVDGKGGQQPPSEPADGLQDDRNHGGKATGGGSGGPNLREILEDLAAIHAAPVPRPEYMMIGNICYGPDGNPCAMPSFLFGPEIAEEYNRELGLVVESADALKASLEKAAEAAGELAEASK